MASHIIVMVLCEQHLLDVKSLRYLSSVTLHDRITKSLLHLHKKKKPPSISAQFQVSAVSALCWNSLRVTTTLIRWQIINAQDTINYILTESFKLKVLNT